MPMPIELLKELVALRIKRVLVQTADKDMVYERNLYNRVGRGVTTQEYTEVLDKLVADGVVQRTTGDRGAVILSIIEHQQR